MHWDRTASRRPRRSLGIVFTTVFASLSLALGSPLMAFALDDPAVAGSAAILVDPDSGTVLYELNADAQVYPASTTKIMTALVTLENAPLDDVVTVLDSDFDAVTADSSVAGFLPGEELTVEQLLYGLMLPSGNDASYILARAVGGDVETFVGMMNEKAAAIGCAGTNFTNPCGLHDAGHYTTARDLYLITCAAMENETFRSIVSTPVYQMPTTNLQDARELGNSNLLLDSESSVYYAPAFGVKTGNTTEAGRCLVAAAEQNDITLYSVVLGCADDVVPQSLTETKRLFEWAYAGWARTEAVAAGTELATVTEVADAAGTTPFASDTPALVLEAGEVLTGLLPVDYDPAALEVTFDLPESYVAPIEEGRVLGQATYSYQGQELGTIDVVAGNKIDIAPIAWLRNLALMVVTNPVFIGFAAIVIVVVAVLGVRDARHNRSVVGSTLGHGAGRHGTRSRRESAPRMRR